MLVLKKVRGSLIETYSGSFMFSFRTCWYCLSVRMLKRVWGTIMPSEQLRLMSLCALDLRKTLRIWGTSSLCCISCVNFWFIVLPSPGLFALLLGYWNTCCLGLGLNKPDCWFTVKALLCRGVVIMSFWSWLFGVWSVQMLLLFRRSGCLLIIYTRGFPKVIYWGGSPPKGLSMEFSFWASEVIVPTASYSYVFIYIFIFIYNLW